MGDSLPKQNGMINTIYLIIIIYFFAGALAFNFINKKKEPELARQSWMKLGSYFVIINLTFFSIVVNQAVFKVLAIIIAGVGLFELFRLFFQSGFRKKLFFLMFLAGFMAFCLGFLVFSRFETGLVLFTFLILSVFDGFSQICGQLFGRQKIFPKISPNKTTEGLIGGVLIAVSSAMLLEGLINTTHIVAMRMAVGIVVFALVGDVATSWFKRQYGVKDFSRLIPGHGGFLDRFDSLIGGGAWIAFLEFYVY